MSNSEAQDEVIQVKKTREGFIVAVYFHGATEHIDEVFLTEALAQAAGQERLTRFRTKLAQHHRPLS